MASGVDIIARGMAANKADLVNGKVPASQLPSYVDEIIEVATYDDLPIPGQEGKIYLTLDTNETYRWSGTTYVAIGFSPSHFLRSITVDTSSSAYTKFTITDNQGNNTDIKETNMAPYATINYVTQRENVINEKIDERKLSVLKVDSYGFNTNLRVNQQVTGSALVDAVIAATNVDKKQAVIQSGDYKYNVISLLEDSEPTAFRGFAIETMNISGSDLTEEPAVEKGIFLYIPSIDKTCTFYGKEYTNTEINALVTQLQTAIAAKQDKLTAGTGITIQNNVISATADPGTKDYTELTNKPKINGVELSGNKSTEDLGINIPTKTSQLTNDSGFITQHQDISGKADKTYVDAELLKKQDKLTAGTNITITSDNVISATGGSTLVNAITANVTVGGVPSGTTFPVGTSLESIIRQILTVQATLTSIAITTPPTKTEYTAGESFNTAGMVVTAYYSDSTSKVVTNYTYVPTGALSVSDNKITVSYVDGSVTKTAEQAITVTQSTSVTIYLGGAGNENEQEDPSEADLAQMEATVVVDPATNLVGQHQWLIKTGKIIEGETIFQYDAIAVPKGYKVTAWSADEAGGFPINFVSLPLTSYNMYYNPTAVYYPVGTRPYITVEEGN